MGGYSAYKGTVEPVAPQLWFLRDLMVMNLASIVYWYLFPHVNKEFAIFIVVLFSFVYVIAPYLPIHNELLTKAIASRNVHYEGAAFLFYTLGVVFAYYKINLFNKGFIATSLLVFALLLNCLIDIDEESLIALYLICGSFLLLSVFRKYSFSTPCSYAAFFVFGFHYWP